MSWKRAKETVAWAEAEIKRAEQRRKQEREIEKAIAEELDGKGGRK